MKIEGITQKMMREACEDSGGDYYIAVAVYTRDGKPHGSLRGPASKSFAKRVAKLILASTDDRPTIVLFGEGYGARIQKGGGNYRGTPEFRLFDVRVDDIWLSWESVVEIAGKLGIDTVPDLGVCDTESAIEMVRGASVVAAVEGGIHNFDREGVVARSDPLMLTRSHQHRVVWKLKKKDFQQ